MTVQLRLDDLACGWTRPEVTEPHLEIRLDQNMLLLPIMGRTGHGKTTLLNVLSGFMPPLTGTVTWQIGETQLTWDRNTPPPIGRTGRAVFGIARQSSDLPRIFTICETLEGLLEFRGWSRKDARKAALEAIGRFCITGEDPDRIAAKYPSGLSGGQQQRMALACAIAHDPCVLFADEPTGNLDTVTRREVLDSISAWLRDKRANTPRAFVFVTHLEEDCLGLVEQRYHSDPDRLRICRVGDEFHHDGPRQLRYSSEGS